MYLPIRVSTQTTFGVWWAVSWRLFAHFFGWQATFSDGIQMASGWLRINFALAIRKSHPSAAAHQLTTRKFATFASNLEKVALRSPGTKVHVEILSSEFLKFQRVFEGLSNVGFCPRARAIFISSSLNTYPREFRVRDIWWCDNERYDLRNEPAEDIWGRIG